MSKRDIKYCKIKQIKYDNKKINKIKNKLFNIKKEFNFGSD